LLGVRVTCKDVPPVFTIDQCLAILFRELRPSGVAIK
jgi:hypothetical protein